MLYVVGSEDWLLPGAKKRKGSEYTTTEGSIIGKDDTFNIASPPVRTPQIPMTDKHPILQHPYIHLFKTIHDPSATSL